MAKPNNQNKNKNSNKGRGRGRRPQNSNNSQNQQTNSRGYQERGNDNNRDNDTRGYAPQKSDSGTLTVSGYSNDPRWYKRTGVLALDSSNFSTYTPNGMPYYIGLKDDVAFTPSGVLRLDYFPCFGDISGVSSPLAIIARDLYDFVNSRNSRSSSYDPSDLMLYCIGVANACVLHAAVRRIIGMYNTYSVLNRYWWDPVMASMGIAPIKNTNDITDWVNLANRMALTLNSLAVPKDITYFDRAQFMCESIFSDSPTNKGSFYYFMPVRLLKYQYDSEGKGKLAPKPTPWINNNAGRTVTPEVVENYFTSLVQNLINDTDIAYMKADIRKAFGEENCYTIPQIDATFRHPFVYDSLVNLQTRNATVHDELFDFNYGLTQDMDTNTVVSSMADEYILAHQSDLSSKFGSMYWVHQGNHVFDFPVDDVPNDLWIEATKLHSYYEKTHLRATSEILVRATAFTFKMVSNTWTLIRLPDVLNLVLTNTGAPIAIEELTVLFGNIEASSKFAAAPLLWANVTSGGPWIGGNHVYLLEDLTNFTMLAEKDMSAQVDSSQLSLFSWRDLAK